MEFYTFGDEKNKKIILIHGVQTPWQIWMPQVEFFSKSYYVIVPALDGHTENRKSEFCSLEQEAIKIENYCIENSFEDIFAICGLSMGGAIAFKLFERGVLKISKLVMDGAPLVKCGKLITKAMTAQYLTITHKSQKRDKKVIESFKKNYLPEIYLDSYLKIADKMTDETIKNMVSSVGSNTVSRKLSFTDGDEILYIYGTKVNEVLSRKSASVLAKYYPKTTFYRCKGCAHCYYAIYMPERWIDIVDGFLSK